MKNISISVANPCKERWETFTPTLKGGHCARCQKEVIDFTGWSEHRIINYFKDGYEGCGRFKKDQLKTYSIPEQTPQSRHWLPILAVGIASIFISKNAVGQNNKQPVQTTQQSNDTIRSTTGLVSNRIKITGKVFSKDDGLPTPGVNVVLKSTTESTVTDIDGYYTIELDDRDRDSNVLAYSFIGFATKEINVKDRSVVDVFLESDIVTLGGAIAVRRFSPRSIWWKIKNIF